MLNLVNCIHVAFENQEYHTRRLLFKHVVFFSTSSHDSVGLVDQCSVLVLCLRRCLLEIVIFK